MSLIMRRNLMAAKSSLVNPYQTPDLALVNQFDALLGDNTEFEWQDYITKRIVKDPAVNKFRFENGKFIRRKNGNQSIEFVSPGSLMTNFAYEFAFVDEVEASAVNRNDLTIGLGTTGGNQINLESNHGSARLFAGGAVNTILDETTPKGVPLYGTVAFSYDTDTCKTYFNGILKSSKSFAIENIVNINLSLKYWVVNFGYYAIRFYNRALTAEEVAANCAMDKKRFGFPQTT